MRERKKRVVQPEILEREREREMGNIGEIEGMERLSSTVSYSNTMPILSLNHVSFVCKSVKRSVMFYEQVLGFVMIKRPSFNFEGAWYVHFSHSLFLSQSFSFNFIFLFFSFIFFEFP